MKIKLTASIFICSLFTGFCQQNIDLNECFYIAFKNNLKLKEAIVNEKISVVERKNSYTKLLPNISVSASDRFSWGRNIDPNTNNFINTNYTSFAGNINSSLTLFSGFSNLNGIKIAKQEVEINKAMHQKIKNDLTIEIASKYTTILFLEELVKANQSQIVSTQKQLEIISLKYNAGYVSQSEVFKVRSQLANQEVTLLDTKNQLESNYTDLKQMLNLALESEITLNPFVNENPFAENFDNDIYSKIGVAVEKNPESLISNLKIDKAKTNIAMFKSPAMPTLRANYFYGSFYSNSNSIFNFDEQIKNNKNNGISFSLSMPIFSQFQNSGKVKIGKLVYEQTKIQSDIETDRLYKVVYQAINDAKMAKKKYDAARTALNFSEKSFAADNLKFELGKISFNDFSITRNNYINEQANLIKTKYEFLFNNALLNFYLQNEFKL